MTYELNINHCLDVNSANPRAWSVRVRQIDEAPRPITSGPVVYNNVAVYYGVLRTLRDARNAVAAHIASGTSRSFRAVVRSDWDGDGWHHVDLVAA